MREHNYSQKNLVSTDPGYNRFVSQQLNDPQEHTLSGHDYLRTIITRKGLKLRNQLQRDEIAKYSNKMGLITGLSPQAQAKFEPYLVKGVRKLNKIDKSKREAPSKPI